ncbi:M48 family metalloprotease [Poseidonocella sedimentorum]|uniref:Putative Zn-dependent protease, contains TPR repeats n=1 Tax=Poseidonocella sedimentorum TaxID=871652 RepID=A0A1I6CNE2_9RHOB|nr:M48 family metalloprotease [Poseidonocella sedimentorum]SFQ94688.1 Putative Zn-dependent protease, contains TPR repeats [Poseidonocella sedimentorum]
MPALPAPRAALLALALLLLTLTALPARAGLIRDPDIEHSLARLAAPILTAAGLSPARVRILVINDSKLNAFVADSAHIFIHSGLILKAESADQLQAVIAHEAAHIANSHIARRMANARNARNVSLLGLMLSAAAAVAGEGQLAGGLAAGTASSAQRVFFAHTRAEEAAADQSGARYLAAAGVDPHAAVEILDIFRGQEALSVSRQDPYNRTHPLTNDRYRAMQAYAAGYKPKTGGDPTAAYWFARAQGKLSAFIRAPDWTLRRLDASATPDIKLMREAIAYHRKPDAARATKTIAAAVAQRPDDAFLRELQGQILLESRRPAEAVAAYARAVDMRPSDPLILGAYGRALLALDNADGNVRALRVLEKARARDAASPSILRDLGQAYARAGRPAMASLAVAERYALLGRFDDAAIHARRAAGQLPNGSPARIRADDILRAAGKS